MKKLLLSFLIVVLTGGLALAQKTINDVNAEKRTIGAFHGIDVGTGVQLTLTEGGTEEVAVSATTTEFRDKIVTKVENGILKIYYENKLSSMHNKKEKKELKAYVSYKKLDRLDANTGSAVEIVGILKSASLKIKANTGATIKGKVSSNDLTVDQNTGSIVTLSGETEKLEVEGDTGSMFNGENLTTGICNAKVNTGAGIAITAQKELYAKAHTGGYVKYKGGASIREINKGTGGTITKL